MGLFSSYIIEKQFHIIEINGISYLSNLTFYIYLCFWVGCVVFKYPFEYLFFVVICFRECITMHQPNNVLSFIIKVHAQKATYFRLTTETYFPSVNVRMVTTCIQMENVIDWTQEVKYQTVCFYPYTIILRHLEVNHL